MLRSAHESDVVIGSMLNSLGYVSPNKQDPLYVVAPRVPGGEVWLQLTTHDDGSEWINNGTNGTHLVADPLFDGLNVLPLYGALDQYVNIQDIVDYNDVPWPPIIAAINECLANAARMKKKIDSVQALFNYIEPMWVPFLLNLNRHNVIIGETGFKLSDVQRDGKC